MAIILEMWKNVPVWKLGEGASSWSEGTFWGNYCLGQGSGGKKGREGEWRRTWRRALTFSELLGGKQTHPAGKLPCKQPSHTWANPQNWDKVSRGWELHPQAAFSCVSPAGQALMCCFHYFSSQQPFLSGIRLVDGPVPLYSFPKYAERQTGRKKILRSQTFAF